jgi:hypothetical protein
VHGVFETCTPSGRSPQSKRVGLLAQVCIMHPSLKCALCTSAQVCIMHLRSSVHYAPLAQVCIMHLRSSVHYAPLAQVCIMHPSLKCALCTLAQVCIMHPSLKWVREGEGEGNLCSLIRPSTASVVRRRLCCVCCHLPVFAAPVATALNHLEASAACRHHAVVETLVELVGS